MKTALKLIATALIGSFFITSCSSSISTSDFVRISQIQSEIGLSAKEKQAAELKKLYSEYGREKFQSTLLEYLKTTHYKDLGEYNDFHDIFSYESFNAIIDTDLALTILEAGLADIDNRLLTATEEEEILYLKMTQCGLLWRSGIYYFERDQLSKGGPYFDQANEYEDCGFAFPANTPEGHAEIEAKYEEYKSYYKVGE